MELAQGPIGGIIHDQERDSAFDAKFKDTYDMGMDEASNGTRFGAELVHIVIGQLRMEHFDSCLRAQVNVLTEVDFGKTAFSH